MKRYITVQGDTWDAIAYRELGSTRNTGALMAANRAHHGVVFFSAGVELTLPEVKEVKREDITIPPWKR